jgi:hypothetical protein
MLAPAIQEQPPGGMLVFCIMHHVSTGIPTPIAPALALKSVSSSHL